MQNQIFSTQRPLAQLKAEISAEIGYPIGQEDSYKHRVATELGLNDRIYSVGWENMTSRECGSIGGNMGGKLGGQMVKRLIEIAERQLG